MAIAEFEAGIRACILDRWTNNPSPKITKPLINQPETHDVESTMARNGALLPQKDARLAELAEAWPSLPEALRAGIVAMVQAAGRGGRKE